MMEGYRATKSPSMPALRVPAGDIEDIFVINDDITVEKPIDEYYDDLDKRLGAS